MMNRENMPFYIGANEAEIQEMLKACGLEKLEDLFNHIDLDNKFDSFELFNHLEHEDIKKELTQLSRMNKIPTSFISDALPIRKQTELTNELCGIRGLTTAYTPYQPERSQGTLETLWLYQSLLSELTGFEAINASLYERSTALYEALQCATRLKKNNKVLVSNTLYPQDLKVLETLKEETSLDVVYLPFDISTGLIDQEKLLLLLDEHSFAAICFPQINQFGLVEDVDTLTNLAHQNDLKVIAQIDPLMIGPKSLKPPAEYGDKGADIFIAEAQHIALGPNLGGPGLGVFGIRFNQEDNRSIRQTPGRYIGRTLDKNGKEAKCIVLSTREQHIRRSKATSNICSNQSFVASLAAGNLLELGSKGIQDYFLNLTEKANLLSDKLTRLEGISLLYANQAFANEFILRLDTEVSLLIKEAQKENLLIGTPLKDRLGVESLKISISENNSIEDFDKIYQFFTKKFSQKKEEAQDIPQIDPVAKRKSPCEFPQLEKSEIISHFKKLGDQNLSPDDGPYPLGSCTMKYNPHLNDWAAALDGFVNLHPQWPEENIQGALHILFEIQEFFKKITGLPALTTQPVAGAQGELVGLKLFQAYHRDHSEHERDVVLIPKSAHGTNPATASVAGFKTIVELKATPSGEIDIDNLDESIQKFGKRIAGIMITNPNTSGVYESNFKNVAKKLHAIDALVYMDGANMNAIAGHIDLSKIGVDAVHNNLHKTWSIPHGGGGPGDAILAVSEKLIDYLPGVQIIKKDGVYSSQRPLKSIGSFHRHWGNFAHKVRCYTYLRALGTDGVRKMASVANLASRYLYTRLKPQFPTLPVDQETPRMHEFIITLQEETFSSIMKLGIPKAQIIPLVGKLFLDFGLHAPTVAFPEVFGLMIEPTESFSKKELDRFIEVLISIKELIEENPEVLLTTPHFTPVQKLDELKANKNPILSERIRQLNEPLKDKLSYQNLWELECGEIKELILKEHKLEKSLSSEARI